MNYKNVRTPLRLNCTAPPHHHHTHPLSVLFMRTHSSCVEAAISASASARSQPSGTYVVRLRSAHSSSLPPGSPRGFGVLRVSSFFRSSLVRPYLDPIPSCFHISSCCLVLSCSPGTPPLKLFERSRTSDHIVEPWSLVPPCDRYHKVNVDEHVPGMTLIVCSFQVHRRLHISQMLCESVSESLVYKCSHGFLWKASVWFPFSSLFIPHMHTPTFCNLSLSLRPVAIVHSWTRIRPGRAAKGAFSVVSVICQYFVGHTNLPQLQGSADPCIVSSNSSLNGPRITSVSLSL